MNPIKVKICGITNLEDAQAAVELGADILGFNFYPPSPRYIEPEQAKTIIKQLPSFVDTAGIFVNAQEQDIHHLTDSGFLNWIQFHGDESPEFCSRFNIWNVHTMKAIRVRNSDDIRRALEFNTHSLLFDAFDSDLYGGTGKTFDWSLIDNTQMRVFVAGGIRPDNIENALQLNVFGVDICSGIESEPGKKDIQKMKALFQIIYRYTGRKTINNEA
jgi:phosphoribosylanthranilate isomerase